MKLKYYSAWVQKPVYSTYKHNRNRIDYLAGHSKKSETSLRTGTFANNIYTATSNLEVNFIQKDSTEQVKWKLGVDTCLCLGSFTVVCLGLGFGAISMYLSTVHKVESLHACFGVCSLF